MSAKDDKNLAELLDKIAGMDEPRRSVMQRMHEVIVAAAPDLKPRLWYGMPGYAASASTPVKVFFRNDELMVLGLSEKSTPVPSAAADGLLRPSAWYFEELDDETEKRVAEIVRIAAS